MNRKECVEESIEKWETIEAELLEEQKRLENKGKWIALYWDTCDYCNYYEGCSDCPLRTYIDTNPICFWNFENMVSHTSITLSLANMGKYEKALEHCRIVLKFMKEDLKKEG